MASPRGRAALENAETTIDALVFSELDDDERMWAERLAPRASLLVATEGSAGGRWWGSSEGSWQAAEPPGPPRSAGRRARWSKKRQRWARDWVPSA